MTGVERIHVELSCFEITKRTDSAIGCGRFIHLCKKGLRFVCAPSPDSHTAPWNGAVFPRMD
ncbi:hypothetical protein D1872_138220 [compost metagenome]